MPHRYVDAILKYLADRSYQPLKPRRFARQMGIAEEEYGTFREAVKVFRDTGRIVLGAKDALMLPEISSRITGFYRPNARGFGFLVPETPNAHGDLFIPEGSSGGAMAGDLVQARVLQTRRAEGKRLVGQIVQIVRRASNRFVGTLGAGQGRRPLRPARRPAHGHADRRARHFLRQSAHRRQGRRRDRPVRRRTRRAAGGRDRRDARRKGELEVETLAVIRAHGIEDEFSEAALADARRRLQSLKRKIRNMAKTHTGTPAHATHGQDARATHGQDARATHGRDPYGQAAHATADPTREDFTHHTVVTIDPPDARDYDDAISLDAHDDGTFTLGVHIADVSHFVREGTALDDEARRRGTSDLFPKKVVPMLPEVLSNGVCSLQQGQDRFCLSALITYDAGGNITARRFARTVIRSAKRLTYLQAQDIIDGKTGGYDSHVVTLVRDMESLARRIESRRRRRADASPGPARGASSSLTTATA